MLKKTEAVAIYEHQQIAPGRKDEIRQSLAVLTARFETVSLKYYETGRSGM